MNSNAFWGAVMVANTLAILAVDAWAAIQFGRAQTLSASIANLAKQWPIVKLIYVVLALLIYAHLFLERYP